jgi:hypothetical protein
MEKPISALAMPAGRSCSPVYESLIHDPPPPSICLKSVCLRLHTFCSHPYDIVFCLSFLHSGKEADSNKGYDGKILYRWYGIKLESEETEIFPYWEGRLPEMSSFAALSPNIYIFGGQLDSASEFFKFSRNVHGLGFNGLFPAASMRYPRFEPQSLVLDGKLFVLGGNILSESTAYWYNGVREDELGHALEDEVGPAWVDEDGEVWVDGAWEDLVGDTSDSEDEVDEPTTDDDEPTKDDEVSDSMSLKWLYTRNDDEEDDWLSELSELSDRFLSDPFSELELYCSNTESPDIEVYDPITGRWKSLSQPPFAIETHFICAALENPNRILVATPTKGGKPFSDGKARFFLYDLSHKYWKRLPERNLHPKCPLGYDGGKALAVGSKLYWITEDAMLLVYYFDSDIWVLGNLKGLGISFLDDKCSEPSPPILLHLGDGRFSMVQCAFGYVHCVIIDVVHKPLDNSLAISVVRTHKYKVDSPSVIQNCFLL